MPINYDILPTFLEDISTNGKQSTIKSICSTDCGGSDAPCFLDTVCSNDCSTDAPCLGETCPFDAPCYTDCSSDCSNDITQRGTITGYTITSTSITIYYTSINYATNYQIAWKENYTGSSASYGTTTSLSYTIYNLQPETSYIVNYRGQNSHGDGPFMSTGEIITTKKAGSITFYDGNGNSHAVDNVFINDGSSWHKVTYTHVCIEENIWRKI